MSDAQQPGLGAVPPEGLPVTFVAPGYQPAPSPVPPQQFSPVPLPGPIPGVPIVAQPEDVAAPGWGMGAVLLGVPVIFGTAILFGIVAMSVLLITGKDMDATLESSWFLVATLVGQQFAMGAWPILVSHQRGNGPAADLSLRFDNVSRNIGSGLALGFAGLFIAACVGLLVRLLLGLNDGDAGSNTQFVEEAVNRPAIIALVFLVVIGAPISEELYFRGMVQHATTRKWGVAIGMAITTVSFTAIHFQGGPWRGTVALFSAIGAIGLLLAVIVQQMKSLIPAMVAHFFFNAVQISAALWLI